MEGQQFQSEPQPPNQQQSFSHAQSSPSGTTVNPVTVVMDFLSMYGWYIVGLLIIIKIIAPYITKKGSRYLEKTPSQSQILENKMKLDEHRQRMQDRYTKMTEIASFNPKTKKKLSGKDKNFKKSSAYRYATKGSWSKDDDDDDNNDSNNKNRKTGDYYRMYLKDRQNSSNYNNSFKPRRPAPKRGGG